MIKAPSSSPADDGNVTPAEGARPSSLILRGPVRGGDFSSLKKTLACAEPRRATLQAELAQLDGGQQSAVIQLTPAVLERHLQGMAERFRSGVNGKVREAIQQSVARILVGGDGTVTLETKPDGLLGVKAIHARLDGEEEGGLIQQSFHSSSDRRWRVTMASM